MTIISHKKYFFLNETCKCFHSVPLLTKVFLAQKDYGTIKICSQVIQLFTMIPDEEACPRHVHADQGFLDDGVWPVQTSPRHPVDVRLE